MDDSHEVDCKTIYKEVVATFCNDFATPVNLISGCSTLIEAEATENHSFKDMDLLDFIKGVSDQQYKETFASLTKFLKSNLADCETELQAFLDRINVIYENHYVVWYMTLQELINIYNNKNILDKDLVDQLIYHVHAIANFRKELFQEISTH